MKKADFYILAGADEDARQQFLCKLLNRILQADHRIYLYCGDLNSAQTISTLLWQASPTSFLANRLANEEGIAPITVGWPDVHLCDHQDVIINLSEHIPTGAQDFERIVEIVIQQEASLQASRERYKMYRESGFQIQHNDMRKKT